MRRWNISVIRWMIIVFCVLFFGNILFYQMYHRSKRNDNQIEAELATYRDQEKRSALIQSVSRQMEEIAYQQKDISETRRLEAVTQTEKANRMQRQAETEREKAIYAQTEAEKAYQLADKQKELAMERQWQAEYSKRVADTLAFLALGRSLGTLSITQSQSGNTDLGSLLAYAAWDFTRRYGGDTFHPAIFNALSRSCRQSFSWSQHNEAVTAVVPFNSSRDGSEVNEWVTCGKYGELLRWDYDEEGSCSSTILVKDSQHDFRSVYAVSNGSVYALSYQGILVVTDSLGIKMIPVPESGCKWLIPLENSQLLVVSTHDIFIFDQRTSVIQAVDTLKSAITCAGESAGRIYLFQESGDVRVYTDIRKTSSGQKERIENYFVTAFCALPTTGFAVGCKDGTILICRADGTIREKRIGHQATVTSLHVSGDKLFSGSYDGTLRMWSVEIGKLESAVILEHTAWIHSFSLYPDGRYIFMGDEQGRLYRIPISPKHMAEVIRVQLKRDFTREEWDYYIGAKIPFESYYSKKQEP